MKLYGARVFVTDMARARSFYAETLGLRITFETDETIGFDMGVQIMIELDDGAHDTLSGRFTGLSITVTDMDAEYERLKSRGVPFLGPPEKQAWGGTLAHFTDPSDNIWTLVCEGRPSMDEADR